MRHNALEQAISILGDDPTKFRHSDTAEFGQRSARRLFPDDVIVDVARARHGSDDECATRFHESLQLWCPFRLPHHPMGHIEDLEAGKVVFRMDEAAGDTALVALQMQNCAIILRGRKADRIGLVGFLVVEIGAGNADIDMHRGPQQAVLDLVDVGRKLLCFLETSARHVVMVDDAHPVDLCAEMCRTPAEEHQPVRPARNRGHRHAAHLAGFRCHRREGRLAAEAGGLFGHEEIAAMASAEIELQRLGRRMAIGAPQFVIEHRIDVKADEIEILAELGPEIDVLQIAQVVEDEPVGIGGAQDLDLVALESRRRPCEEAVIVLHMAGAQMRWRHGMRQHDLVEVVVGRCPEMAAPGEVQVINRRILVTQIVAEGDCRGIGERLRDRCVQLVVRLPADDMRIVLVVLRHCGRDAAAMLAQYGACCVAVLPRPMTSAATVSIHAKHFGIVQRQPARRGRGRRAEDRLDAGLSEHLDRAVEEVEVELAFKGLPDMPGELAHAHGIEAGFLHAFGVALPITFVDMLRIVGNAEQKVVEIDRPPGGEGGGLGPFHGDAPGIQMACSGLGAVRVWPLGPKR